MGSTREDLDQALSLCRGEVYETQCIQLRPEFIAERYAHEVTVSSFELDRTEVTVSEYLRCVAAEACEPPSFAPSDARYARGDLPVTHVRWEDATAYCAWAHGRLPTEAEWEYAARGSEDRIFPWGNVYNRHLSNHGSLAADATDASDGFIGLAAVGSFPDGATPLGILDMAGNAAEYVSDFFDLDDTGAGYPASSQVNPKGPPTGVFHVVRGGSYLSPAAWLRGATRGIQGEPTEPAGLARSPATGFRCAADLP
jgi:formylglycine-generating enzyme required for sulfatase activity